MTPSLFSSHRQIVSCLNDLKVQYQELHEQLRAFTDNGVTKQQLLALQESCATKDELVALQGLCATKDELQAEEKKIREEMNKNNALLQV